MNEEDDIKYNSIVDEYHRNKRIVKKLKFKEKDINRLWDVFLITFKRTFKIKEEMENVTKFSLSVKKVTIQYNLDTFDPEKKVLILKWNNNGDKYKMTFNIKKKFFSEYYNLIIKNEIKKSTTFFGLQDTAGLIWWKKTFKNQMKTFYKSMEHVYIHEYKINKII